MKIIAVTVTYNRLPILKQHCVAMLSQTRCPEQWIIVDNNSTDGTKEYLLELKRMYPDLLTCVFLPENTGGSGGFEQAIRMAYEYGMDYIWGMDDDAIPEKDALALLEKAAEHYPEDRYCLRSNTYYLDSQGQFVLEQITQQDQISGLTFVGFFIPYKAVSKIGFPRGDLFIYYDEVEYQMRLKEAGYEILGIRESIVYHPYIMPENKKKFLGRNVLIPEMPKWKMYYWMRNNLLIRKGRKGRDFGYNFILEVYVLLKILVFKKEEFGIACKGFLHGLFGVSGHLKGCP